MSASGRRQAYTKSMTTAQPDDVKAYYENVDDGVKDAVLALRKVILKELPGATERMSYGMPFFVYAGKDIVALAPAKRHLGFYTLGGRQTSKFGGDLLGYKTSKAAIQLPYDQSLPVDLIKKIIDDRKKEIFG